MAKSAQEAMMAVEEYYALLVKVLPITKLLEDFHTRELLSFDQKSELDSLISPKEKTEYFLDCMLLPGLSIDYTGHFDGMVIMMKESDDVLVKDLVEKLMLHVSNVKTNSDAANDSDGTDMKIDFNAIDNISIAFSQLLATITQVLENSTEDFRNIRSSCVARASEPLRDLIKHATNTHHLLKIFFDNKEYCNWMDVRFLKVIANACGNKQLQSLIESYKAVIYSKKLHEIWDCIPKDIFYSELKATFHDKDPDNMTVEELIKLKPLMANKMAVLFETAD